MEENCEVRGRDITASVEKKDGRYIPLEAPVRMMTMSLDSDMMKIRDDGGIVRAVVVLYRMDLTSLRA